LSPITVRSILYLANINGIKPAVNGKDYFVEINNITDSFTITPQINKNFSKSITGLTGNSLLNLSRFTNYTSNYIISSKNKTISEFPANFDKSESETTRLDSRLLEAYLMDKLKLKANIIKPGETISASILELREGRDIWHYFLIFALICIIGEYLIARSLTKKK
jgi:hypothetical protein